MIAQCFQRVNEDVQGNVVLSPASAKVALTSLVEATGGQTRQELLAALRLPQDDYTVRRIAGLALTPLKVLRDQDSFEIEQISEIAYIHICVINFNLQSNVASSSPFLPNFSFQVSLSYSRAPKMARKSTWRHVSGSILLSRCPYIMRMFCNSITTPRSAN